MKKILFLIIILSTCLRVLGQHSINGSVKNAANNTPISGAVITIPDLKIGAVTNSSGAFTINNVPNGTYIVTATFLGFSSEYKEINSGEEIKPIDFALTLTSKEMGQVVVTGVSSATEQKSTPIPVTVITQNDLLQNSAHNVVDALQSAPGVSQISEGPAISKPVIRGLGYNRVVVVNDGIRQEGQQWGDEFGIEIDDYSVDKVEILRGPASLSYGSDAMAGVINFLPAPTLPEGQIKGNILANYGTNNGLIGGSANLAGNIKGIVWDLRYSDKVAHFYQNPHDGYVWNSGYAQSNLKGSVGINRQWGYSRLIYSHYDLKLGIIEGSRDSASNKFLTHYLTNQNTDSAIIAPDNKNTAYNFFPLIHQHVNHDKIVWDNSLALGGGRLGVRIGWQQNNRREANDITQGENFYNNYFFLQTLNYDIRYILPEKNHFELSVGANGMQQHSEDRGTVFLVPEYNSFDIGGFAIAKKSFNKFAISGGLRYDTRTFKGNDMYIDTAGLAAGTNPTGYKVSSEIPGAYHRFTAYTSNFSGLSASLGGTYDVTKNIYLKLNAARGYRAHNIAESGADGIHDGTPYYEIGVHDLKPENSLQFDLTAGFNYEDVTAEVTAFSNTINNYIFPEKLASKIGGDSMRFDPISGLPPGQTFKYSQGTAQLTGGEVVLNIHPHTINWLHFNNSFSVLQAIQKNYGLRSSAYDSVKYLPYTPPFKYQGVIMAKFKTVGKAFKNSYVKLGIDYVFAQNNVYYKAGTETPTPGYTLLNGGLGTDICNKKGNTVCSIFIYGTNLANIAYLNSMSRLKYAQTYANGTSEGVYEMGRNIGFKLLVPIDIKH